MYQIIKLELDIAGFIVKKTKQIINCDYCSKALVDEQNCHILIDIKIMVA